MQTLWQDVHYGVRMLRRSPGFTLVAVLTLALGIGANTAIFSLVDAVLLRMLPVSRPERLVMFGYPDGEVKGFTFPYPMFEQFRDRSRAFSGMFAITEIDRSNVMVNGEGGGREPVPVHVELVSGSYFSVLGAGAVLGRALTPDDDRTPGGHPVAVISAGYWKRRFAEAPDAVGRTLTINQTTCTIIGVTPPGFYGEKIGHPADVWIPIAMQSEVVPERPGLLTRQRGSGGVRIVARLRQGMTLAQSRADTGALFRQLRLEQAGPNPPPDVIKDIADYPLELRPEGRGYALERAYFGKPLLILTTIVGLVLLIACANLATLLLARGEARQKEIATRMALGAGRWRVVRQLLTESILLASLGGAAGLLFAVWTTEGLLKVVASGTTPLLLEASPDARILGFTAAVCLTAGILFGLLPALRATRVPLVAALRGAGSSSLASGRGRVGPGRILVVVQVALALVLLVGAGLFTGTLRNLKSQDIGFDRERVLLIRTDPGQTGRRGAQFVPLYEAVEQRIGRLPGVSSASVSSRGLLGSNDYGSPIILDGQTRPDDVPWDLVAPGFFETVGMRLIAGRDFSPGDNETAPRVAIVNESFARHYFGNQNPVGHHLETRGRGLAEIIGVVRDAKYNSLREQNVKMIYRPWRQDAAHLWNEMCVVVRTLADPAAVAANVRRELGDIDPTLPVLSTDTVEAQMGRTLVQERLIATLSGLFGLLALVLSSVGLYGIVSCGVTRRTHEIGIRLALGATPGGMLRMVLRESLLLVPAGIAVGVPAALGVTRPVAGLLFGVRATDPATISLAVLVMLAITFVAGCIPARRATRVDPMIALRHE
ncbi:MAG TPA: ABC transporter permease [Blastocatellia bacterium]|nr:ABC transporter permease [Blastocatellia bacterium]